MWVQREKQMFNDLEVFFVPCGVALWISSNQINLNPIQFNRFYDRDFTLLNPQQTWLFIIQAELALSQPPQLPPGSDFYIVILVKQ